MKCIKQLDTKDIRLLADMDKLCTENSCSNCIFADETFGCLYEYTKDAIIQQTGMTKETLNSIIKTACETNY